MGMRARRFKMARRPASVKGGHSSRCDKAVPPDEGVARRTRIPARSPVLGRSPSCVAGRRALWSRVPAINSAREGAASAGKRRPALACRAPAAYARISRDTRPPPRCKAGPPNHHAESWC